MNIEINFNQYFGINRERERQTERFDLNLHLLRTVALQTF